MIEKVLNQFSFDVENLKQLSDKICVNYNENKERYTIYYLESDNRITTHYIQGFELELIEAYWSVNKMKKLVLLIAMTSLLLVACGDSNAKLDVASYLHEVNDGYMYKDQQGNDIFIDNDTLASVGANTDDKLNITYDNNGYEIESIEIVEAN